MPLGAWRLNGLARFTVTAVAEVIRQKIGVASFGNAQVDTAQSKFGGASALFDGTGDGMVCYKAAMPLTGDFTVEYWIYQTADSTDYHLGQYAGAATGRFNMGYDASDDKIFYFWGGSGYPGQQKTSSTISLSTWYHVALTREGGTLRLFLDGVLENTQTGYTSISVQNTNFTVGYAPALASTAGNIDEVRVSNIARYTTAFTPSTTPFVNDENTLLLLHMDGTDGSTVFEDDNGVRLKKGITAFGSAQVDTAQSYIGGASLLLDGTGDYLRPYPGTDFAFGTSDFTLEFWFRRTGAISTQNILVDMRTTSTNHFLVYWKNTNFLEYYDGSSTYTGATTLAADTWYHVAISRSGTSFKIYLNGAEEISQTNSRNLTATQPTIGAGRDGSPSGGGLVGNMDELRISNIARYTTTFTPSTTPFVNDSNTLLLLHMDGTDGATVFEDDNGVRTKVGVSAINDAQIDTAQSKFGGASALFDGVNDNLTLGSTISNFGSGDWTMECWFRRANTTGTFQHCLGSWHATAGNRQVFMGLDNGPKPTFYYYNTSGTLRTDLQSPDNIGNDTWYHYAVVGDSTNITMYVDGVQKDQRAREDFRNAIVNFTVGGADDQSVDFWGHIDEVRISNIARYTAAFTPPTAQFQNDSNTILLLHMDGTDGTTYFPDDNGVPPDHDYS